MADATTDAGATGRVLTGLRLLPRTLAALDAAGERTGLSRAAVVELLVTLHAGTVVAGMSVPLGAVPPDSRARKRPKK